MDLSVAEIAVSDEEMTTFRLLRTMESPYAAYRHLFQQISNRDERLEIVDKVAAYVRAATSLVMLEDRINEFAEAFDASANLARDEGTNNDFSTTMDDHPMASYFLVPEVPFLANVDLAIGTRGYPQFRPFQLTKIPTSSNPFRANSGPFHEFPGLEVPQWDGVAWTPITLAISHRIAFSFDSGVVGKVISADDQELLVYVDAVRNRGGRGGPRSSQSTNAGVVQCVRRIPLEIPRRIQT